MRQPTEFELQHIGSLVSNYDPVKAHEYYLRTRKLKGRKRGSGEQPVGFVAVNARRHQGAKARQRQELQAQIKSLSDKLQKLEAKIREMEHEEAREDRKSKAKKERAAKERDKPKTAAEKAEAARDAKKWRAKNQQKLKSKATSSSGGDKSSGKKKSGSKKRSVSDLKALATRVRGQIAVAKQKLAAL